MDEPTLEQSILYLMRQAPAPVQNFILTRLGDTVLDLMATHALHVDQAGVLESELLLMLVGQTEPAEFSKSLQEVGITEETTRAIMKDVNELVFKKLREEERMGMPTAPVEPPKPPQVPVMGLDIKEAVPPNLPGQYPPPPVQPAQAPMAAPVPPPQPITPPAYAPPAPPIYQAPPPATPIPIYSNPQPPVQPQPVPKAQPYIPVARTMERDVEMAMQGPRPETQPSPSFVPPAPIYQAPPPPAPAPIPQAHVPPPPPPPAPNYPPPAMASVRLTPVDRTHSNDPITKEYGNDPYREPIE